LHGGPGRQGDGRLALRGAHQLQAGVDGGGLQRNAGPFGSEWGVVSRLKAMRGCGA